MVAIDERRWYVPAPLTPGTLLGTGQLLPHIWVSMFHTLPTLRWLIGRECGCAMLAASACPDRARHPSCRCGSRTQGLAVAWWTRHPSCRSQHRTMGRAFL